MQMWLCDIDSALIHLPGMIMSAQTSFEQQINVCYLCFHTFFYNILLNVLLRTHLYQIYILN